MTSILMDLLSALVLLVFLYQIRPIKSFSKELSVGYLSLDTGKALRGFFALVVIFHHLSLNISSGLLFRQYSRVGFLAVAIFFFLSGYGLQKSYISNPNYKDGFLLKRIPSVLFPYIIITCIFWLLYCASGTVYSLEDIVIHIASGSPIVPYSWYVINIVIFYVIFWILMRISNHKNAIMLIGGLVSFFAYVVFCRKMGYGEWWYNASILLIVGMFWAVYENKLVSSLKNVYWVFAAIIWVIFISLFFYSDDIANYINMSGISVILSSLTAIFFVLGMIMFFLKFKFGNPILMYLGKNSLELYLCQGIFIIGLSSGFLTVQNDFLYSFLAIVGIIVFAHFLHKANQYILQKYRSRIHL